MFGVAKIKSADPLEKRFHGLCAFVRLHLMKAAEGDVEAGFAAARGRGMIGEQDERFSTRFRRWSTSSTWGIPPDGRRAQSVVPLQLAELVFVGE